MKNHDYSYEDIVKSLRNVGLVKGDKIFIHSNIGFFGRLKDSSTTDDYYKKFKNAIIEVIGNEGTFVVPTFSYSFTKNEIFDVNNTPGVCGIFSEMVRKDPQAVRSVDPNFSVASIGPDSKFFTENMPRHSFGLDSFWDRFLRKNGKICNFNFDAGSTFFHYVEKVLAVPYRYDKEFSGTLLLNKTSSNASWIHFVFDHDKKNLWPNFEKFDKKARSLGLVKISNLGKGQITCVTARDTFNLIQNELKNDPSFLIDGPL
ncbi:MAG: AAC(3) family N-acetyltransferase [Thermoproteota archaeon]